MKWDFNVGQPPNIVMWVKNVIHVLGRRLDFHKMIAADKPGCYHTHPARAFRLVLWNGYVEEVLHDDGTITTHNWKPWSFGIVEPELCHRISELPKGTNYSLWLRGKVTAPVKLRGWGWPADMITEKEME